MTSVVQSSRDIIGGITCEFLTNLLCGTADESVGSAITQVFSTQTPATQTLATAKTSGMSAVPASERPASESYTDKVSASESADDAGPQALDDQQGQDLAQIARVITQKIQGMLFGYVDGHGVAPSVYDDHRKKVQAAAKEGSDGSTISQVLFRVTVPHQNPRVQGTVQVINSPFIVPVTLIGADPMGVFFTLPHVVVCHRTQTIEDIAFDRVLTRHIADEYVRNEIRKTGAEVSTELLMEAIQAAVSPVFSSTPLASSSDRQVWAMYTEDYRTEGSSRSRSLQRVVGYKS